MKWKEKVSELKDMNLESLKAKDQEYSEELFWLKMKNRAGQLSNYSSIEKARKDLARVKTFIKMKEKTEKKQKAKEE